MVTATGAFGIIAADACDDYGLELAPFPEGLRELEEERIAWHQLHNPVDIWPLGMVTGSFTGVFRRAVGGPAGQRPGGWRPGGGAGLRLAPARRPGYGRHGAGTARRQHQLISPWPCCSMAMRRPAGPRCRELAREPDVACFDTLEEAVMGLAATWRYHAIREAGGAAEIPGPAGRRRPSGP